MKKRLQSLVLLLASPLVAHAQEARVSAEPPTTAAEAEARLAELVVQAESAETGLARNDAPELLKLGVPLSETPQTVVVVPEEVLEKQAAQSLKDVFRNVSGVFESGNTLNAQSEVLPVIRGFETPSVFRDGMRATQVGTVDLFNIESVEVLKGPASILFGGLEPGGVLNFTTKKPLATPFHEMDQQIGSYEHFRTTFDSTGPLDSEGRVLYRLNAAYTNSGSFRDHMDLERYAVAPSILWHLTEDTEVGFDFAYVHERQPYDTGVPVGFNGERLVADDTFFNDPSLDGRKLEDLFAGIDLNHRFNDQMRLRSRLQYHRATPTNESIRPRDVTGNPGSEVLRQRYQNEDRSDDEWQLVSDLLFNFKTGAIKHNALVGLDLIKQDSEFDRFRTNTPNVAIPGFDSGSYNFVAPGTPLPPAFRSEMEWAAIYAQDQMSLADERLHLLIGGRFDYVNQDQTIPTNQSSSDEAFTGRLGALYEATDWFSPYVSLSQSFRPQFMGTNDQAGNLLDPETGIQYEAGMKFNFFEERLLATLSVYQIDKEDVAVSDPTFTFSLPGVDQRSRGVELDVVGKVTDCLSIIANYAYTDTEVTRSETSPGDVGNRLGGVPLNALRVWLAYDFPEGTRLEGLGFGIGARYESDRLASFDTTMLDDYLTFDAGVWYRHELPGGQILKTQINIQNLTDEDYYARASTQAIVHPGAPLGVMASVGLEF